MELQGVKYQEHLHILQYRVDIMQFNAINPVINTTHVKYLMLIFARGRGVCCSRFVFYFSERVLQVASQERHKYALLGLLVQPRDVQPSCFQTQRTLQTPQSFQTYQICQIILGKCVYNNCTIVFGYFTQCAHIASRALKSRV